VLALDDDGQIRLGRYPHREAQQARLAQAARSRITAPELLRPLLLLPSCR
jgi:hypothetical protein